jgi:hypothetical protein
MRLPRIALMTRMPPLCNPCHPRNLRQPSDETYFFEVPFFSVGSAFFVAAAPVCFAMI